MCGFPSQKNRQGEGRKFLASQQQQLPKAFFPFLPELTRQTYQV
ncbi:hypothetical protein CLOM621_07878 [Clostridium sp. M62/1]|nr:hypothetical protein CLOM621_07878 [Clostridium sp. M62/1]